MPPVELDSTAPPSPPLSLEEARIFQSVSSRLFGGQEEQLRLGTYRLIRRLGGGGMGEVFLAHDDALDRHVALKLVHARLSHEAHFADRMRREARALAKLTHPNVVHVYEVGEHQGRVFIAMEYVQGQSLAEWIRDVAPPWRAILDAYRAAGEGLVAAHAAGLTHRDFKPDNVLRGADGRVCVADFGLARVGASAGESEPGGGRPGAAESGEAPPTLDQRLSATGAVMGTPNYMPLEQVRGGVVDARSDQFSFCVALYEGLWGRSPHDATSLGARDLVLAEDRPVVPPRGAVPGWVWPIVRRGLARDPDRRWPDMRSLLDQLREVPLRRRTRQRATAGLLGLSLAAAGGWVGFTRAAAAELCALDPSALTGVWDEPRRQALQSAFAATGLGLARETATRVERSLDAWAERWTAERAENCAATRIHGVQSETTLDRRTICLDRQRVEVDALVDAFAAADADVVAGAGAAVLDLPEVGACGMAALDAQTEAPIAPADRAEVEAGYEALARARAALRVGRTREAIAQAELAHAAGEAHKHDPLALEARVILARVKLLGGELQPGLDLLHEVVMAAGRAGLFDLVATARVELARSAAGKVASPLALREANEAELDLRQLARPDDPRLVRLLTARGRLAEHDGEFQAALQAHRDAYKLAAGRVEDPGQVALLRAEIGQVLFGLGEMEAARAELEPSLSALEAAWGPGTVDGGRLDFSLGMVAANLGEFDAAEWHLESATAIDEAAWGDDSLEVARDRFAQAHLAFARGEITSGCALIEQVRSSYETLLGPIHDETAAAITAAALCRYYDGDFLAALAGYQRALAIQTQVSHEDHVDLAPLHANIGEVQLALGALGDAFASYTRALELQDAAKLEATHPDRAFPLKGQALVWLATREPAKALGNLERALELADASRPVDVAEIRFGLARALVDVRGRAEEGRALDLAHEALQTFERVGLQGPAREVRAWLEGCAR